MRSGRPILLCALILGLPATAQARVDAGRPAVPTGLKAFLLRAEEPTRHEFSRTPSFAWSPVSGALRYEFELATSKRFSGSSIVWTNVGDELEAPAAAPTTGTPPATGTPTGGTAPAPTGPAEMVTIRSPTMAVDVALPWITGSPYALYAHVRAITAAGPTPWSKPFGFNVRWSNIPRDLDSPYPGLIRWSPVEGASSYEVWLFGARKTFATTTNVADARELYTFHRTSQWTSSVSFRVRAKRTVYGEVASGLPATTFGPWSPIYTDVQPPLSLGTLASLATVADTVNTGGTGRAHGLTPGFAFAGDRGGPADYFGQQPAELYRVYVATDKDCVNVVFRSAIVGSPAYAPRLSGPLALPQTDQAIAGARTSILDFGSEGAAFMLDGTLSLATEAGAASAGSGSGSGTASAEPKIDLPDTAWPSGGYYWTVVPVQALPATGGATGAIEYRETELPQDACQAGRRMRFGKLSPPVVTGSSRPFASGLSPQGRLTSAARSTPFFYGTPLVAWQPALAAQDYEVQWSKTGNPFKPVANIKTPATSALLPLSPGTWYYRVRGFNNLLPKRPQLAWSDPVRIKVAKPVFRIVKL
ncbi:MAG: hypothetical protein H0V45_01405 [Actinobacteria bacterium]|nr:hypothetical protein [Actinomycetota bacterium]